VAHSHPKPSKQAFEKNDLVDAVWPEEASDGKLHFYPGRIMQVRLLCSGSEAGSYLRLIDFVYHSTLGLRVIKKKKQLSDVHWFE